MKILKRSSVMLVTLAMMVFGFTACGSKGDTNTDTTKQAATAEKAEDTTDAAGKDEAAEKTEDTTDAAEKDEAAEKTEDATDAEGTETITVEEAIELVKQEVGDDFSFIPADELEEKDGSQYYVIYVKTLLDTGTLTTQTTYLVKTDGSEVFDKYITDTYVGEYVLSGVTGETVFEVFEDGTFEMTTTGDVNQVVSGVYEFGITDSASVIELKLYPRKNITEYDGETTEEEVSDVEGTATIEDGKLTLAMESELTVFTKK
ncbi:MAG: hypothetical protein IJA10_14695 [Lachnospiraceae bacterium]|nr:hypothetical protein [Lachnospiraceae bacterium]